jgi:pimeloyl-ACP methyl ester carboxylesterase
MSGQRPVARSGSSFMHGFARERVETSPAIEPGTWWGSQAITMPEDVQQTLVRLQAEDGGHSRGVLYRRGDEKTVIVYNHPRGDFSCHFLIPLMLEAGIAGFGGQTRTMGNDANCAHEELLADIAGQVRYLRAAGFENVILLGNSGGGSLSTFYHAQAVTPPPHRLTDTAAGDPYDLNDLDLPPTDALILMGAHVGEGLFMLDNIDPSVTDEDDPLSCDPALDMFNPDNGYRLPPESSSYSPEFIARYRAGQRSRCARLDAIARQDIARRRRFQARMAQPEFAELALEEHLEITKQASASSYLKIARTCANLAYADLSIDPSQRPVGTLIGPDPLAANYRLGGFASVMTPEGWLSTWSGLSSRANVLENIKRITDPLLIISFTEDCGILPHDAEDPFALSPSPDKQLVRVEASHYATARDEPVEAPMRKAATLIAGWLGEREML